MRLYRRPVPSPETMLARRVADIGQRLEHVILRYQVLIQSLSRDTPVPNLKEVSELLELELAFVIRLMQEVMVDTRHQRKGQSAA